MIRGEEDEQEDYRCNRAIVIARRVALCQGGRGRRRPKPISCDDSDMSWGDILSK
jgi:hypothetical protein